MFETAQVVAVHSGGVPLPRAVEVGNLDHAAQVTSAVGVRTWLAFPVVGPERLVAIVLGVCGQGLAEPGRLLPAVEPKELHAVAGDLLVQVGQQRPGHPVPGNVLTLAGHDPQEGVNVALADAHGVGHDGPPWWMTPRYGCRARRAIRRTSYADHRA